MDEVEVGFQGYLGKDLHEDLRRDGCEDVAFSFGWSDDRGRRSSRHCWTPDGFCDESPNFDVVANEVDWVMVLLVEDDEESGLRD